MNEESEVWQLATQWLCCLQKRQEMVKIVPVADHANESEDVDMFKTYTYS